MNNSDDARQFVRGLGHIEAVPVKQFFNFFCFFHIIALVVIDSDISTTNSIRFNSSNHSYPLSPKPTHIQHLFVTGNVDA